MVFHIDIGPVTPGITALEYAQRRSKLANKLPQNAIAVLAASEVKYRAAGIFNEYRQDSNFFYLTGMSMLSRSGADSILIHCSEQVSTNPMPWRSLVSPREQHIERLNAGTYTVTANDGSGDNHIFHLYVREKDPKAELWDGARSGTRAAIDVFNADEVRYGHLPGHRRLMADWYSAVG